MKNLSIITSAIVLGSLSLSSCSTTQMAASNANDNLYFMASDVRIATQYAVANNNPATFQNLDQESGLAQENFSSRNVNPEYISRYGQTAPLNDENDVVYFEDNQTQQTNSSQPDIDVYNNFSVNNFGNNRGWRNTAFNMGFGFGGFGGFSPFSMGFYDPFFDPFWGFRPGFNVGLNFGFGRPFYDPFNPFFGVGGFNRFGGFYDPFWGGGFIGSPWGWGRPILATGPIIVLPGSEFGNRRVVYGSRPTRGASMTSAGARGIGQQSALVPGTARAQARSNAATSSNSSARRLVSSENSRVASRDFSATQNDYYNSGRSRVSSGTNAGSSRNVNSAATDRGSVSNSRSSVPSARPSSAYSSNTRTYTPSRGSSSYSSGYQGGTRSTYNRSSGADYNNSRSVSPSYNRNSRPSYNSSGTTGRSSYNNSSNYNTPSRSSYNNSSSYSAPSRSSSGGSSFSAPSRSTGGSSGGGGVSGGSRGRGN